MIRWCRFFIRFSLVIMVLSEFSPEINTILYDLPVRAHLYEYIVSLEKVSDFVNLERDNMNFNLFFGIFIINVNLKRALRSEGMDENTRLRLKNIVSLNQELMSYYIEEHLPARWKSYQGDNLVDAEHLVLSLFLNTTAWSENLSKFNINIMSKLKFYTIEELEQKYQWFEYKKNFVRMEIPLVIAGMSDVCLIPLSRNAIQEIDTMAQCSLSHTCSKLLLHGSNYGYKLTYRILILILTRFARGCYFMSPSEDKRLLDNMCTMVYNEAEFITLHNFELVDLLLEQQAICALEGHAQFLRSSWIERVLKYQTMTGDFRKPSTYDYYPGAINNDIVGVKYDGHTTCFAAGVLAAAVRLIVEKLHIPTK